MKSHRKKLLLFLLVVCFYSARSQNLKFGGTGNFGLSKITSNLPEPEGDFKVKFTLSGNFGLFLEKKISQKSSLGIEALFIQIEGKEVTDNQLLTTFDGQNSEVIGEISSQFKLHSSYVCLPIYYRCEFGKLAIKGGLQPMIFLFASSNYEAKGELYGEPYEAMSEEKDIKFNQIDLGPKIGIDYKLNENIRLRTDYYHGLFDITSDAFPWQRRYRQINFGVQYIFS